MVSWRIYYDDGTTFDSDDGPPHLAPKRGVQAIVRDDPQTGFMVLEGHDHYWWEHDQWVGGDKYGFFDYLSRSGRKVVLFGRSIRREEYERIVNEARNDPDFPRKSAKRPEER